MSSREDKANWGCASWDGTLNNNFGGWSYKGCVTVLMDSTHVRCYCDHLTSFAVISETESGYQTPKFHKGGATNTAYIVCSLLLLGLGIMILSFIIFRRRRRQEIQVQDNLPLPVMDTNFTSHIDSALN
ncbi:hypothetical protein AVEN_11610-1 [Araneus ventricosus]|uniref:GAIN-B domain-containing protein n=1 Tax=Araneus ventricosus TaxID=182803 RepID=A0A4Y2VAE0_ARAVE|nr:hypothetical protein AVEN_11610-1 [Araneus ventricosus]